MFSCIGNGSRWLIDATYGAGATAIRIERRLLRLLPLGATATRWKEEFLLARTIRSRLVLRLRCEALPDRVSANWQ